jgi:hypothetical protein
MPTSVPTADEFSALAARVTALEQGAPPSGGISKDGAKLTDSNGVLTDDQNDQWRITSGRTIEWKSHTSQAWVAAGQSANVAVIEKWKATCFQSNTAGGWWSAVKQGGTTITWTAAPGDPSATPPNPTPTGMFHFTNNQILDPAGNRFRPVGVNVNCVKVWGDKSPDYPRASSSALKRGFPKLNAVRFANWDGFMTDPNDPGVKAWINDVTSHGIVVECEVHWTGNATSGGKLQQGCDWLAAYANVYKNNPYVWYGTQNEPHGGGIQDMMLAMLHAVRGTGCMSPVLLACGDPGENNFDGSRFANEDNTGFDMHYYGWMPSNGMNWDGIVNNLNQYHSRSGVMPVCCLETGDATDGKNRDGNWQQVLDASCANPNGFTAWYQNWDDSEADRLLAAPFDYSALTDYGVYVRDRM